MIKHYQPSLDGVECSLDVSIDGIESTYGNRMFGIFREWEGRTACFDLVSVNFDRTPTKDQDGYFGMKHEVDGLHRVINQQGVDLLAKQAENERLIALNAELADLAGSTVGMLQGGGWLALADEIKDAIAKVDAPKGYARLIAAAPDLLSALKAMIDEHEPLTTTACDMQNKVRALIDKVEGESCNTF